MIMHDGALRKVDIHKLPGQSRASKSRNAAPVVILLGPIDDGSAPLPARLSRVPGLA